MSEPEDFAAMFAREAARPVLEIGQVVKGRVIQISAESVFVDVGGKGEAWIERAELTDDEGRLRVAIGDEVEATVVSTGDEIRLSHKLRQGAQARQALAMAAQTGIPVEGKVAAVIKGGYEVTVGGLRGFCPFSQMDVRRVEATEEYVGRVLEFRVTTFSESGRNLVLSRRRLLEERDAEMAEETRKKILPGAVLSGHGGLPRRFRRLRRPGRRAGARAPLRAVALAREPPGRSPARGRHACRSRCLRIDQEKGRISLSLKALEGDPWIAVAGRLRERQVVRGRAVRSTEFGVFVELLPGVDGLLHITEIPRSRQGALREAAAGGAEVFVLIVAIDRDKRRVALALAPEGAELGQQMESSVEVGAVLTGTVERHESFGVFVRLGPGQTGLVPTGELAMNRGADPRKTFPAGSELKVMVLAIEEGGRRIRLSHAQALAREEQAETQAYMRQSPKRGDGFGLTLGEAIKQGPKKRL